MRLDTPGVVVSLSLSSKSTVMGTLAKSSTGSSPAQAHADSPLSHEARNINCFHSCYKESSCKIGVIPPRGEIYAARKGEVCLQTCSLKPTRFQIILL